MNYLRGWADRRNATGFASECARLALPFYEGDHRQDLVVAIRLAERCTRGETIDADNACIAYKAYRASYDSDVAHIAYNAYKIAAYKEISVGIYVATAAHSAASAIGSHETQTVFARWAVRDLSGGRELPTELRQAAGAAIVAGNEDLARALVKGET